MSRNRDPFQKKPFLPPELRQAFILGGRQIGGAVLMGATIFALIAVLSFNSGDPSFNTSSPGPVANLFGKPGAAVADILLQWMGLACFIPLALAAMAGYRMMRKQTNRLLLLRIGALGIATVLLAFLLTLLPFARGWPVMAGMGGATGYIVYDFIRDLFATLDLSHNLLWITGPVSFVVAAFLAVFALELRIKRPVFLKQVFAGLKARVMGKFSFKMPRLTFKIHTRPNKKHDSAVEQLAVNDPVEQQPKTKQTQNKQPDETPETPELPQTEQMNLPDLVEKADAENNVDIKKLAKNKGALNTGRGKSKYKLPPLSLLTLPEKTDKPSSMSDDVLNANAARLEEVLAEFGVKGEIVKIRPGPVVTLYELEPVPGTKTARVIGLSDDIARSMSAVSVRIAVVTGSSTIGIELPNEIRDTVFLRELLSSKKFSKAKEPLTMSLGKDLGGRPVFVDLAKMPHLLIAGTTGSGKSVAVNSMILSLLYRLEPKDCRLIMIDPKMLEFTPYNGIPHLLTPVVTDPGKAIVALKWAVREMEDRYKAMSQLGVRNIDGYNQKIKSALKNGEELKRTVQTGFDTDGKPIYEEQALSMETMPFIVVIVDEMADLMMVAGKDVEAAIQRLAQMARAAGIHLIMSTQRPSVDVITGTVKANFPTRISLSVTSKIDSRTILGEHGAEQLLGRGDMLYMPNGQRPGRVHGPFVSDEEIGNIVAHLAEQEEPEYITSVTEDDTPSDFEQAIAAATGGNTDGDDALYDEAVAVVLNDRKVSTSYIQRKLKIGYNRAATLVEQMEEQGLIGPANHVGKREILVPENGMPA